MRQDRREYINVSVDLPTHPKLAALNNPAAAGWAALTAFCYCGQHLTDGEFPLAMVLRTAGVEKDTAEELVSVSMWHLPDHDCPHCPQPRPGHAQVHDYLMHNRSKADAEELRVKRSTAGAKGAARRWDGKRQAAAMAPAMASAIPPESGSPNHDTPQNQQDTPEALANAMANAWQDDGKPMAEEEVKKELTTPLPPAKRGKRSAQRGTRISEDFQPTPAMVAWAREKAPHVDGRRETEKFVNYWLSKPGQTALKLDWPRTWQNWLLEAEDRTPQARSVPAVPAEEIPAEQIDPDRILGKDHWQAPTPPPEVDEGPVAARRAWFAARAAEHRTERVAEARAYLARKQNRSA